MGRVSHFLVECPGKAIATYGTVCMPYFGYNDIIDLDSAVDDHVLDKTSVKWTANNKQWPEEFQCMNSNCELVSQAACTGSCICYDDCPLGYSYYPTRSDWSYD